MSIWRKKPKISELNSCNKQCVHKSLGIEFTKVGSDYLEATMPVDKRTHQIIGFLHGGASALLAESIGSAGSYYVGPEEADYFGVNIHASHVKAVRSGFVRGKGQLLWAGNRLLFWDIFIFENNSSQLISKAQLTVYCKKHKKISEQ